MEKYKVSENEIVKFANFTCYTYGIVCLNEDEVVLNLSDICLNADLISCFVNVLNDNQVPSELLRCMIENRV